MTLLYLKVFSRNRYNQSIQCSLKLLSPKPIAPAPPHPHPQQKRILKPKRKFSCLTLHFNLAIVSNIAFINCATSWKTNRKHVFKTPSPCPSSKAQPRVCHKTNVRFFQFHSF